MTELSPEARAILDAGRDGLSPSAATKAEVFKAVSANAGGGAVGASSGGISSIKLLMVLLVAAGLGGAVWLYLGDSSSGAEKAPVAAMAEVGETTKAPDLETPEPGIEVAPPKEAVPTDDTNEAAEALAAEEAEAAATAEAEAAATAEREAKLAEMRRADLAKNRKNKPKTEAKAPTGNTLLAERKLIAAAQVAIRGRKYKEAQAILGQHKREFPKGILSPERDAARAIALCLGGEPGDKGAAAAKRFLRKYKNSPLAQRVKSVCEQP
jgi:hypothetical protein